jgi:hypothetical protein
MLSTLLYTRFNEEINNHKQTNHTYATLFSLSLFYIPFNPPVYSTIPRVYLKQQREQTKPIPTRLM